MAYRIQGMLFVLFGIVGLFDGWRISTTVRPDGSFDTVGPDRYLLFISGLLVVLGLALAVTSRRSTAGGGMREILRWPPADYLVVGVILAIFIWAIPLVGFSFATAVFFVALYRLLGGWSWPRTVIYGLATAAAIYLVFVYFSGLPMPKSVFGI